MGASMLPASRLSIFAFGVECLAGNELSKSGRAQYMDANGATKNAVCIAEPPPCIPLNGLNCERKLDKRPCTTYSSALAIIV
jgi:hypothetical protein